MTLHEEIYQELRELPPSERAGWLQAHAPVELRGHWWLALIEHAQFDASPARGLPADETMNNLDFAVELVELAEADGMPSHQAASRLALLASAILKSGQGFNGSPQAITPDRLGRRIVDSFRLDLREALTVAARLRASPDGYEPGNADSEALREINWVLMDLELIAPYIEDVTLASVANEWLNAADALSPA